MNEIIYQLEEADAVRAGSLLARAFLDEPVFAATLPDPADRLDCCQALFTANIRHACTFGEAWAIGTESHTMLGVAYWVLKPEPELTDEQATAFGFTTVMEKWGAQLEPIGQVEGAALASLAYLPTPWRYLAGIGVEPEFHRQGLGTLLLEKLLADAHAANLAYALTTDRESNVSLYERVGFTTVEHQQTSTLGIPFWAMATQPPTNR